MARPTSDLLKNFGKMFEVVKTLINAILDVGGTDADLLRVLKEPELARQFAQIVVAQRAALSSDDGHIELSVNYGLPLEQAIAAGAFDWKNDGIVSKNFPNQPHETGEATLKIKLFHFGRYMSSEEVIKEMDKEGFRPATLRELLAFAAKFPDAQRKCAIVALGSFLQHLYARLVPSLGLDGSERELGLGWWGGGWVGRRCRFLAVRKS